MLPKPTNIGALADVDMTVPIFNTFYQSLKVVMVYGATLFLDPILLLLNIPYPY